MLDGHVELELPAEPSSPQIAREAMHASVLCLPICWTGRS